MTTTRERLQEIERNVEFWGPINEEPNQVSISVADYKFLLDHIEKLEGLVEKADRLIGPEFIGTKILDEWEEQREGLEL